MNYSDGEVQTTETIGVNNEKQKHNQIIGLMYVWILI